MLSLIGAIFHLIGGLFFIFLGSFFAFLGLGGTIPEVPPGQVFPAELTGIGLALIAAALVFIVLAFLGAIWTYSGQKSRTTWGGVLTLVIAIIALPTLWGVFIGSLLGFIGAILALVWTPTPAMPAPAPAAMPPPAAPEPAPAPEPDEPAADSEE